MWRVYVVTVLSAEYVTGTTPSLFFNRSYGRERSFEFTCAFQLGRVHVLWCTVSQALHNQQYRRPQRTSSLGGPCAITGVQ